MVFSNIHLPFFIIKINILNTFIKDDVLSLFLLFKFDPNDLIEFLSASVVGEFTSNYYFYSSVN